MKGKISRTRHKESNRFKFKSFSERIAEVKVDVYRKVKHVNEKESEEETYLFQCLEKWTTLNCSDSFSLLLKEISFDVKVLAQVIKRKEHIVNVLLDYLDAKDSLSVETVLELVVALAKDLRQDFYPYYPQFHSKLINLLDTKNKEQIEWTFHCFAYLFKYLWRCVIADLPSIFASLLPLFSSKRPVYINNFAAESFAFIARKVKDKKQFLKVTLKLLKKNPDGIDGCGRLLFEVVKGIPGQFHSCAEETLTTYLESLADESVSLKILTLVLKSVFSEVVGNIKPPHSELIWKPLQSCLVSFLNDWKNDHKDLNIPRILNILDLIKICVEYKSGIHLKSVNSLVDILLNLIQDDSLGDSQCFSSVSELLAMLLLSANVMLSQDTASRILASAMSYFKDAVLLQFIEKIITYSGFNGLVLPRLLDYSSLNSPELTLLLLAKTVLHHSPLAESGDQLVNFTPYPLNIPKKGTKHYSEKLIDLLSGCCEKYYTVNLDSVVSSIIVMKHLVNVDKNNFDNCLKKLICLLCESLKEPGMCSKSCSIKIDHDLNNSEKISFIISLAIETFVNLKNGHLANEVDPHLVVESILPYCSDENVSALRALDFFITSYEISSLSFCRKSIIEKLTENLLSPYHKVRLLSCHIMFELEKGNEDGTSEMLTLLETCWLAEQTPIDLTSYRDKLRYANKLNPGGGAGVEQMSDPGIAISLILGLHFVNFKLLWSPLGKILISYARQFKQDVFWCIFVSQLRKISTTIRENANQYNFHQICEDETLSETYQKLNFFNDRPDYINYRILMWTAMVEFPELCELKNRDISSEFITFLEEEYFKKISDAADSWNIKNTSYVGDGESLFEDSELNIDGNASLDHSFKADTSSGKLIEEDELMQHSIQETDSENEMEIDHDESVNKQESSLDNECRVTENDNTLNEGNDSDIEDLVSTENYKWATKSLLVHLELLSKMKNPKAMSKEQVLYKYYLFFLSSKLSDVQKCALDCLMTYNHKFLNPYKENLYGLIDDKSFKKEINLFRIGQDSSLVRPEHRENLIPIILRIVSGKMYATTRGKNSKDKRLTRKGIIVRFLGGCSSLELQSYLEMSFPLFVDKIQGDAHKMVTDVLSNLDLEKIIPPRRLQSSLDLLNQLVIYCAGLLEHSTLSYLLRLLLLHGCYIAGPLCVKKQILPGYWKLFKELRKTVFSAISWFYGKMEEYKWSENETNAVFEIFVWPWIDKLPVEGVYSPTPVLQLFSVWSENPRYFGLMGKCRNNDNLNHCPLSATVKLWMVEKAHKSVYNIILDIVEHLVTLIPPEDVTPLTVDSSIMDYNIVATDKGWQKLNLGSKLLIGFVESILEVMRRRLAKGKALVSKEMEILSRVTELVTGGGLNTVEGLPNPSVSQAHQLLALLIPVILKKKRAPEHVLIPLLSGIKNLLQVIPDSGQYFHTLVKLVSNVRDPIPRKLLMSIIVLTFKNNQKGHDSKEIEVIEGLNSYNIKWLDQPDFDRRLDAFKSVLSLHDDDKLSLDLGLIVIHTCFHFIKVEKDLALRDNASQCLKKICPSLSRKYSGNYQERQLLIDFTILNLLQTGIRNYSEEYHRNESIVLLGCMVRKCHDLHPVLRDLKLLSNETDLEMDFFENMQHLQYHRRIRAMVRFCETAKEYTTVPTPRTMTQFMLPIISFYLCNDTFDGRPTVIDAAAQAMSTVCRLLPWHQYFSILKFYLGKLQTSKMYAKQLLRINVEILNAFHFDLKNAESEIPKEEETVENEKPEIAGELNQEKLDDKGETEEANNMWPEIEHLEDEREIEVDENEEMCGTNDENSNTEARALDKIIVLSKSSAQKVVSEMHLVLIPRLLRCLAERTKDDNKHTINRRQGGISDSDEQEMLRIPLAVAVVKLLLKLPDHILQANVNGVVMKVVTWLKSRVDGVRRTARQTLQEIAVSLGPSYLPMIIKDMTSILSRGFHIHVLAYSMNGVLNALKPLYQKGDMDHALPSILQVCQLDLFGDSAEEKEVGQIIGRVMEAKSCKSYNAYNIISSYISDNYLVDLIMPLKEQLSKTLSHKVIHKIAECLRLSVLGLMENQYISAESLLLFAYGTASQSIPALSPNNEVPLDPKDEILKQRRNPDMLIIPKEPKKEKAAESKACSKTNSHLLVEFGLNLLHYLLRKEKLNDPSFKGHLDPLVNLLLDCLKSQYIKISTLALKCLLWVMKFDLPSLRGNIKYLSEAYFAILHKYAAVGMSKRDNFELVHFAFKAVAVLIKDVKFYHLDPKATRVLLLYCEQDLEDHSRQATAFSLLKAIIVRKITVSELDDVMKKVGVLSVTADLDSVRMQARQVMHNYIMEYPLGKAVNGHIAFYYNQIEYENDAGRESVLLMLKTFVDTFPIDLLKDQSGVMFVKLAVRLVNDPSPECRKLIADILSVILTRVDPNIRNELFDITQLWIKDKISLRRLATQLYGLFVVCEKEKFSKRLHSALPDLVEQFYSNQDKPGRFVLINPNEEGDDVPGTEKVKDHLLFQVLQVLAKIITHVPDCLVKESYCQEWVDAVEHAHAFLNHPHEWVRLGCIQILGLIMTKISPSDLAASISSSSLTDDVALSDQEKPILKRLFSTNTQKRVRSITLDVLAQLTPKNTLNEKFLIQCMKLLVYIGDVLKDLTNDTDGNFDGDDDSLSLLWLVKKVRKVINAEVVQAPSSITVRKMCFNWLAAMAMKLESSKVVEVSYHMIAPLARELSLGVEGCSEELKAVASEALSYIKNSIGQSEYSRVMQQASAKLNIKRAERRKERAQMAITDPVRAAKRKIQKQQKKKEMKKRKISLMKNVRRNKKAKISVELE